MKISNISEFYQFVKSNNFINLTPEITAMVICLESYSRLCPCDPPNVLQNKLSECKTFYTVFLHKIKSVQNDLLNKVTDGDIIFYNDNQYITTITR